MPEPATATKQDEGSGISTDDLLAMLAERDTEMQALKAELARMKEHVAQQTANLMALEMGMQLRQSMKLDAIPQFMGGVSPQTHAAWKVATMKRLDGER